MDLENLIKRKSTLVGILITIILFIILCCFNGNYFLTDENFGSIGLLILISIIVGFINSDSIENSIISGIIISLPYYILGILMIIISNYYFMNYMMIIICLIIVSGIGGLIGYYANYINNCDKVNLKNKSEILGILTISFIYILSGYKSNKFPFILIITIFIGYIKHNTKSEAILSATLTSITGSIICLFLVYLGYCLNLIGYYYYFANTLFMIVSFTLVGFIGGIIGYYLKKEVNDVSNISNNITEGKYLQISLLIIIFTAIIGEKALTTVSYIFIICIILSYMKRNTLENSIIFGLIIGIISTIITFIMGNIIFNYTYQYYIDILFYLLITSIIFAVIGCVLGRYVREKMKDEESIKNHSQYHMDSHKEYF